MCCSKSQLCKDIKAVFAQGAETSLFVFYCKIFVRFGFHIQQISRSVIIKENLCNPVYNKRLFQREREKVYAYCMDTVSIQNKMLANSKKRNSY